MTFPVLVEQCDGQFVASLVGTSKMRAVKPTRSQSISSLESEIHQRIESGELFLLEIDTIGVSGLSGKYSTDSTLRDICDNAYKMRDEECYQ